MNNKYRYPPNINTKIIYFCKFHSKLAIKLKTNKNIQYDANSNLADDGNGIKRSIRRQKRHQK